MIFQRKVSIRASTTSLRHSIVTYSQLRRNQKYFHSERFGIVDEAFGSLPGKRL